MLSCFQTKNTREVAHTYMYIYILLSIPGIIVEPVGGEARNGLVQVNMER